jgi:hypothetical protein
MFEIKLVQNSIVPKNLIKKKGKKRDQDKKKPARTQNQESINDYLI